MKPDPCYRWLIGSAYPPGDVSVGGCELSRVVFLREVRTFGIIYRESKIRRNQYVHWIIAMHGSLPCGNRYQRLCWNDACRSDRHKDGTCRNLAKAQVLRGAQTHTALGSA